MGIIGVICLGVFIYGVYQVFTDKKLNTTERLLWLLVMLITNLLGVILYFIFGRKK